MLYISTHSISTLSPHSPCYEVVSFAGCVSVHVSEWLVNVVQTDDVVRTTGGAGRTTSTPCSGKGKRPRRSYAATQTPVQTPLNTSCTEEIHQINKDLVKIEKVKVGGNACVY